MIVILDEYGIHLGKRNRCFYLQKGEVKRQISPFRVTAIQVRKACEVSTPAILLAAEHDIPLLFFNRKGKAEARLWQSNLGSHPQIRRAQLAWSTTDEARHWACQQLLEKTTGQEENLRWLGKRVPSQLQFTEKAIEEIKPWHTKLKAIPKTAQAIRVAEGQIGRIYWAAYFQTLAQYEKADKRTRRPAKDPLNALINYGYGMLYGEVESAVLSTGLDPQLGVLHEEEYARPAFVFDAIEQFRPWVDRLVAELAVEGEIGKNWFRKGKEGVWLQGPGKKVFIPAWYELLDVQTEFLGRKIKKQDQIQYLFTTLARQFLGTKKEGSE